MTSTLIVAHRRLETTQRVARAVLESAGAADVWVWVDGPRDSLEASQTREVANLLRSQPWPGSFQIIEHPENHGVAFAVPRAVDWVLKSRSDVVVLEDDCLPTPEFFTFAHEMLDRFRKDLRVGIVSGTRIVEPQMSMLGHPCNFSSFPLIWGWATWADRWDRYSHDIRGWRSAFGVRDLQRQGGVVHAWDWYRLFNSVATENPWSWDYQLTYMLWRWHQIAVVPGVDLVENIGFGALASHTSIKPAWAPQPPAQDIRETMIESLASCCEVPVIADSWVDGELRRLLFSPPVFNRLRSRLRRLSNRQMG